MSTTVEPTLQGSIATAMTRENYAPALTRSPADKVYAVVRWGAAIQAREDNNDAAGALTIVALGPQQFLPPEGAPVNDTAQLAVAFVFGGSDYAELFEGSDGKHYYRVRAGNHEIVDGSQGYATASNARRALIKRHPGIDIREQA